MSTLKMFIDFIKIDPVIVEQKQRFFRKRNFFPFFIWINLFCLKNILFNRNKIQVSRQLDFVFWCSDETQWKNQFPVLKILVSINMNVVVLSNKKRICNLIESLGYQSHYLSTKYFLGGYGRLIRQLWEPVVKISRENHQLKWILVGNDLRWDDRMVCKAFQMNGIRAAVINHGLNHIAERLQYLICDVHFAWSDKEKEIISKFGSTPDKVHVSGSPALDETLFGEEDLNQKFVDTFIKERVPDNQDIILISFSGPGGQISEENHRKNIAYLKCHSEQLKKNNFVALIKLHPKDQPHYYLELLKTDVFHLIPKEDTRLNANIFLWIKRAFALVSGPSTTMIDAMVMSKPAIYCDLDNEGATVEFVERNIVPSISSKLSLIEILCDFKNNTQSLKAQIKKQSVYLDNIYRIPDGKSASRIAEYLMTHD